LTWEVLGEEGKQWPGDGLNTASRFRVVSPPHRSSDPAFPFRLVADRLLYDHGVLIRTTERFSGLLAAPVARFNPADLKRVGLRDEGQVQVTSPYGAVTLPVQADPTVPPGVVVIAYSLPGAPAETLMGPAGPGVAVNVVAAC
jgi:anaerobic selenocysteine-containing dehydrogenase